MATKYGFAALNQGLNVNGLFTLKTSEQTQGLITSARVKSIILDETHPRFKELGEWNALGVIEFTSVTSPTNVEATPPTAAPIFTNNKGFPLLNEIVYILTLPDSGLGTSTNSTKLYYISPVSLWNHPHHNGFPVIGNAVPPEQQKDYTQTAQGSVRRVTDSSSEINLGHTFIERANIHPILPFEGDIIQEGRWGNSVRLGSTVPGKNSWSTDGKSGDPITILRNGQPSDSSEEGWIPISEDVNKDLSSIYITSTQKIPIQVAARNQGAFKQPPIKQDTFNNAQILLNSDRIVLNAKNDSILASADKSIGLFANKEISLSGKSSITLDSTKVYLGSTNATEPLLKGEVTAELLKGLISNMAEFVKVCEVLAVPVGDSTVPLQTLNAVSSELSQVLKNLLNQVDGLKSKTVYTL
jgi:hypothetical protein